MWYSTEMQKELGSFLSEFYFYLTDQQSGLLDYQICNNIITSKADLINELTLLGINCLTSF